MVITEINVAFRKDIFLAQIFISKAMAKWSFVSGKRKH
jgi:hypothetical protein